MIDITVAEQPSTVEPQARAEKSAMDVQHIPGFYVGTLFIPDTLAVTEEGFATDSAAGIAQQWMAFAKRSSSPR